MALTEADFLYSLAYIAISVLIIVPPTEFVSAGITVQNVLSKFLGSEQMNFILYHQRRTTATLIVHSLLPIGYYILKLVTDSSNPSLFLHPLHLPMYWQLYLMISLAAPACALALAFYWSRNKWKHHPIARCLASLAQPGTNWLSVAESINIEFRRIDKFTTGLPGRRLIVTDSWLILTSTYTVRVAYQMDTHLAIVGSEEHNIHYESIVGAQFLNILVSGVNTSPFHIRLNAAEYTDLRDKLRSPIMNIRNIIIQQSLSDRFLEAFKHQVQLNPTFRVPPEMELESCIGCMQVECNVKLMKSCEDVGEHRCVQCNCRPKWCIDCMGRWFASRQDQAQPDTWLASKSPCPTCRSMFCMLDICRIV